MRAFTGTLGCLIVSVCYASTDAPSPATTTAAAENVSPRSTPADTQPANQAPAQAQPTPQAPSAQQPTAQLDDHALRAKGYQVKMINGEKYYCRREDVLGTRLQGALQCTAAEELRRREERSQQTVEQTQRNFSKMPDGGRP